VPGGPRNRRGRPLASPRIAGPPRRARGGRATARAAATPEVGATGAKAKQAEPIRFQRVLLVLALVAALAATAVFFGPGLPSAKASSSSASLAPDFSLTDIYGHDFTLSHYRTSDVVLIEFTALSCAECQVVEQSISSLYSGYNQSGKSNVQVLSVYIEPQFGDSIPALQAYHVRNNITWTMAQDTPSLAISSSYGVSAIPNVFIIDKQGHVVYEQTGAQSTSQLQSTISSSLAGTAAPISIVTVSVFALAAIAGVSTFFSPCAFPMFPGYMGLFRGLSATNAESASASSGSYKGAARRAVLAGSVTALGMIVVFLAIGVALILAASLVGGFVPYLMLVVGVVLIALGALLLTNLQYWRVVTPFQALWQRIRGTRASAPAAVVPPTAGKGFHLKLFSYGMGYAAAAAGCVAPVIFSAIIAGLALGLLGGIINILIYSLTAALLMIVVTVMLGMAGKKYINQLKALTPVIKKVSAVALLLVGAYLIYFYWTAWIR
jgi:cytochrome c-type biogenesis protein